jgi:hypothetical protein
MKRTFTQQPVTPKGYTGRDYNKWMAYVNQQVNKLTGTKPMERLTR